MMRLRGALAFALVLAFAADARAANGFAGSWFQLSISNASNPCQPSRPCIYWSSVDSKVHLVDASGNDITPGAGGGTSTLKNAYAAGATAADGNMLLDSTRGKIQITDAATPLAGTLFSVTDNSGNAYFSVADNGTNTLKSGGSSGSTSATIDTVSSWTGGTLLKVASGGTTRLNVQPFGMTLSPVAVAGAPTMLTLTAAASTANTSATEVPDVDVNLQRSVNWATGALATQRFFRIRQPTITFTGASNVTGNIATMSLAGPPLAGTNATFTGSAWTLWLESGNLGFGTNAAIGQSATSAAGTTAFAVNCNVADNASSVCFAEKNSTTTTTAILHAWENSAGTIEGQIELDTILAGSFVLRQPSSTYMGFLDSGNNGFKIQAGLTYFRASGTDQIVVQSGDLSPVSPGFDNLGVANYWATTKSRHFSGGGTAPTKAAGACIGGTQTVSLDANASDAAGTLTLTGTATGTASSTCATVTFNTAYASAPHCQIAPANAAAAALSGAASLYVDSASTSTTVFVVKSGATALVAGTYLYSYDCMQ